MEESKYAQADSEQLQEINNLEDKLRVTLIAYDTAAIMSNVSETDNGNGASRDMTSS